MEEKKTVTPHYKRVVDICVDMYTQDETIEKRLVHGRALLNTDKGEFVFAQNPPRGARSIEVFRTGHARMVRRPDGRYTVTFSCLHANEKMLREQMLSEVRALCSSMKEDAARCQRENKKKEETCE